MLLKNASQDPFVGGVASGVLKRLMEDVVAAHDVRECFKTLPSQPRVPTFSEVRRVIHIILRFHKRRWKLPWRFVALGRLSWHFHGADIRVAVSWAFMTLP